MENQSVSKVPIPGCLLDKENFGVQTAVKRKLILPMPSCPVISIFAVGKRESWADRDPIEG
jgi:hypothetical protein